MRCFVSGGDFARHAGKVAASLGMGMSLTKPAVELSVNADRKSRGGRVFSHRISR